ncbi:MAG TPA: glycosyltransferase family 2 protein [Candidatus Scatomonas pullistercoris]|uniref:Glycosyltransferase family 2 protein n=1 Tax=Candidatus Scatomonas pullistercoris TaxID=2840920 RepID=A0A9D1P296_9FIRM|nr:glycosyltransferase family 2 protein [Candidatus Scatomonas pullistercoris]
MDCLYIIIPAYNEETNIGRVLEEWYPVVERHNAGGRSRLVVINDGSRDRTGAILDAFAAAHPLLLPLSEPNRGHGGAVLRGYHFAAEQDADYVFQTDSDGQTRPEEFEKFWKHRKEFAMVIGDRRHRQDGFSRVLVTRVLRLVLRLCFRVKIRDANTPYRLMQIQPLRQNLRLIPKDFGLSNVLLSVLYAKRKLPVLYLPITFRPRQGGVNSINLKRIFRIGRQALGDFLRLNRRLDRMLKEGAHERDS